MFFRTVFALSLLFSASLPAQQLSVRQVFERASPSVVTIYGYDAAGEVFSLGSGFVLTNSGQVATNFHVIEGAAKVKIKTASGKTFAATGAIDYSIEQDFVILKTDVTGVAPLEMGNTQNLGIGDEVVVIGNPQGLERSLSTGIVSQFREERGIRMIQTTAPISKGSSGGPLLDRRGKVMGIITAMLREGQNLNFAVPVSALEGRFGAGKTAMYTISELAAISRDKEHEEMTEAIREMFVKYDEPQGWFSLVVPRDWKSVRKTARDNYYKGTSLTVMFAPADAHKAQVDGYLSEGIRVSLHFPQKGNAWTTTTEQFARSHKSDMEKANKGFALVSSDKISLGSGKAEMYAMVGQNENIPEPEKTYFIVQADKNYLLVVELVSPTSKLQFYQEIYSVLIKTLKIAGK